MSLEQFEIDKKRRGVFIQYKCYKALKSSGGKVDFYYFDITEEFNFIYSNIGQILDRIHKYLDIEELKWVASSYGALHNDREESLQRRYKETGKCIPDTGLDRVLLSNINNLETIVRVIKNRITELEKSTEVPCYTAKQ